MKSLFQNVARIAVLALALIACHVEAGQIQTYTSGGTIAANARVKISGANVVSADIEDSIGVVHVAGVTNQLMAVETFQPGATITLTASGAITVGADVYPDTSGLVTATIQGGKIGKALNATTTSGDACKVLVVGTGSSNGSITLTWTFNASSVDAWLFVADRPYIVVSAKEVHSVAGSDGAAVSLDLRKVTDASAPGASSGSTVKEFLATAFDLKSTANTTVTGTLNATAANYTLATGNKIGANLTGTLTALAGGCVTIVLQPQ